MGNFLCCTKQPDRELRSKLIIGSLGAEPIGMNHGQIEDTTIYDDGYSWVDTDTTKPTKPTLV